jgi:ABC-type amino acid transport substrate-binding protein
MKTDLKHQNKASNLSVHSTKQLNKPFLILFALFISSLCFSQSGDTLTIDYLSRSALSSSENGQMKGIEVDILAEYANWLKNKKNTDLVVKYNEFKDFDSFFTATQKIGANGIGSGGVIINKERAKEVDFTDPYLKNVAFCITNGNAPEVKSKSTDDIIRGLGSMSALTIQNTNLNVYVNELKKQSIKDLKIQYYNTEAKILEDISKNVLYFGYVDAIGFWFFLKSNPSKVLKIQKNLSQSREEIGFVLPKGSRHKLLFNEFFSGSTGFKSTPAYRAILEKHLGSYMAQNVTVK